jgi:trk/ktr system potassium uptake protein
MRSSNPPPAPAPAAAASRPPLRIPIPLRLVLALAFWIAFGTLALILPGITTSPLSIGDAFFTATSAATVTGLTVVTTSTAFTFLGQVILLVIIQIGGLGFIVVAALFVRLRRRRLGLEDRLALASAMHLDTPGNIISLLTRLVVLTFAIEGLGALLLYFHWRFDGIVPADEAGWYAVFHAISAYCNAGFDLFSGSPQFPNGLPEDNLSLLILGVLIILGGLGMPLYIDVMRWRSRRRLGLNTKLTIVVSILLVVVGMVGLLISEYRFNGVLTGYDLVDRTVQAWFQSVAARTAGFPGLEGFSQLHSESQLLLICLMFIGTAPASMGGGITTGTFAILMLAFLSYARGYDRVRVGKRSVAMVPILRATTVLAISSITVLVATWLVLLTQDFRFDETLFEVVSAFSTTGLSMGITSDLNSFGRLIIIGMMFWGRLGALTLIILFLQRKPPQELVEYPEVQVLVA